MRRAFSARGYFIVTGPGVETPGSVMSRAGGTPGCRNSRRFPAGRLARGSRCERCRLAQASSHFSHSEGAADSVSRRDDRAEHGRPGGDGLPASRRQEAAVRMTATRHRRDARVPLGRVRNAG